uniref:Cytochrome P450 n=1 Tax=Bionectria ochroleuca TaxID=29856 RepID=A0A8H7K6D5_BIOOC
MAYYLLLLTGIAVAGVYLLLTVLMHLTQHAEEPPIILSSIPFFSPIICVFRERYKLYLRLFHQYKLPIYTLRLPFTRLYLINETSLISAVEKHTKVFSFAAIEAKAMGNLLGMSEEAKATLREDPVAEDGHFMAFHKAFRPAVSPGLGLDSMIMASARTMAASLNRTIRGGQIQVDLFQWVEHEVLLATTDAEFGPGNPFRDPEFEAAWYVFEPCVPIIASNICPRLLAGKALAAREYLYRGFFQYLNDGRLEEASAGFHARFGHSKQAGFSLEDIARGEIGAVLAILNNAIAAGFWMLYHIFTNPALLEECRREVAKAVTVDGDTKTIDLSIIESSCPTLHSTFHEVLRYRGVGTLLIRRVLEDHKLGNRYFLKKGGLVLMPNAVQHFNRDIWGDRVNEFQYQRFNRSADENTKRYNPTAFRAFGGGSLLCPGRHFAIMENLAFVSLTILSFDIEPATGGAWAKPKTGRSLGLGVARIFVMPENNFAVNLSPREGGNQQWRFVLPRQ